MPTLHQHVSSLLQLFFILYATPFISAQSPPDEPLPPAPGFNPSLAVLMVIIVGAFFLMGFFSVYIRGCVDRRFTRGGHFNTSASPLAAGGRWSLRRHPGLEPEVIDTFPTFLYSAVRGYKIGKDSLECAVCLNEFEDDETLRLIPKCNHVFHSLCIDEWLAYHTTCPVCRANLVPKPDDLAFDLVQFFETSVRPNQTEPPNNVNDHEQEDVLLQVTDDHDRNTEMPNQQSPDILSNTAGRNRPPRSWSTGWRFGRLFPRSKSTGHTLVQPGENVDRFTLRLPNEIRSQLMNTHLNRTKSCAVFPRASSSKKGFRSRSGGWPGGNSLHYERFDQSGLTSTPPLISKSGSVRSSKGLSGSNEVSAAPPKSLFKSAKSPFDQLILGVEQNNVNGKIDVGERSSDRLRIDDSDSQV